MQVNSIGSPRSQSFGSLNMGYSITQKLAQKGDKKAFIGKLNEIKKVITDNKFDRKKYVDIDLYYKESPYEWDEEFYAVISPKNGETPLCPGYRKFLSPDKNSVKEFGKWLNSWNKSYSPKAIMEAQEFQKALDVAVKKIAKEREDFDKALAQHHAKVKRMVIDEAKRNGTFENNKVLMHLYPEEYGLK